MLATQLNRKNVIIDRKINRGSFADIYSAIDFSTSQSLVIKIERPNAGVSTIDAEAAILRTLQAVDGVPKVLWSGKINQRSSFITQRLGSSLYDHMALSRKFSLSTVIKLAIELLRILEQIHEQGILHLDLKPTNILTGLGSQKDKIFLIDFNLSKPFIEKNGKHISLNRLNEFNGNIQFSSVNSHQFLENSRKDDLESLGFLLYFLYWGKLSWDHIKSEDILHKIAAIGGGKKAFLKTISNNPTIPACLKHYFISILNIGFFDKPNYEELRKIFTNFSEKEGIKLGKEWEWDAEQQDDCKIMQMGKKASDESTDYFISSEGTTFSDRNQNVSKILKNKNYVKYSEECDYGMIS
jgi:serine/threonine protein kinase